MAHAPMFTPVDDAGFPIDGAATVSVAAGAVTTVVKANPGRLCRIVVTGAAAPTGALTFYDNATTGAGTILAIVPSGAAPGTAYAVGMPAARGITAVGATGSAAVTVSYA